MTRYTTHQLLVIAEALEDRIEQNADLMSTLDGGYDYQLATAIDDLNDALTVVKRDLTLLD